MDKELYDDQLNENNDKNIDKNKNNEILINNDLVINAPRESIRRVSFAAEHQINYIYQDEYNSTKTSSSMTEIPMDFTTEIPEFKNIDLFKNSDEEFLRENVENLFVTDRVIEYREDPVLLKQYSKRRQSIGRRSSLDPLRVIIEEQEISNIMPQNTFNNDIKNESNNITNDNNAVESAIETDVNCVDLDKDEIANELGVMGNYKENSFNNGMGETTDKKLGEGSFNDTAIYNSSFVVEELVNTIDLKNIINCQKKERKDLNEFLASVGIRFLDDSVVNTTRRDTLSKSRNDVDPALKNYYKYSVKERIEYLNNFSGFLSEKIVELQDVINEVQKDIDCESLNKDDLKKIRNESRNKSKIDWYGLRKLNELQFNKKIAVNKGVLQDILNVRTKELENCNENIEQITNDINNLKKMQAEINEKLGKNETNDLQRAERLEQMICDRKSLLCTLKSEYEDISKKAEEKKVEENMLDRSIAKLKIDVETLKKNLLVKSINESDLEIQKKRFSRYTSIFDLKINKILKNQILLNIQSNEILFNIDDNFIVTQCRISAQARDPFLGLVLSPELPMHFKQCLRQITGKCIFASALRKEVENITSKMRTESFLVNEILHIRFYLEKKILDVSINSNFELVYKNDVLACLRDDLGFLTKFVERN